MTGTEKVISQGIRQHQRMMVVAAVLMLVVVVVMAVVMAVAAEGVGLVGVGILRRCR
jgi:hypothetical protein